MSLIKKAVMDFGLLAQLTPQPDEEFNPWAVTFYVCNAHRRASNAGTGLDWEHPLATVQAALDKCLTNRGDRIIVGAGHAETIAAAAGMTCSKNGVTIIGLGWGDKRPAFTFATSTAATWLISGDGVTLKHLNFTNSIDSLVTGLSITGHYSNTLGCVFVNGTAVEARTWITTTNANYVTIQGNLFSQLVAGSNSAISIVGGVAHHIADNHMVGDWSMAGIQNVTTACSSVLIHDNVINNLHACDCGITMVATSRGHIYRNYTQIATDAQTTWIIAAACALFENYGVNVPGETGKLCGTVSV